MIKVPGLTAIDWWQRDGGFPAAGAQQPGNRRMNRRVEIAIMQGKPTVSAPISGPSGTQVVWPKAGSPSQGLTWILWRLHIKMPHPNRLLRLSFDCRSFSL